MTSYTQLNKFDTSIWLLDSALQVRWKDSGNDKAILAAIKIASENMDQLPPELVSSAAAKIGGRSNYGSPLFEPNPYLKKIGFFGKRKLVTPEINPNNDLVRFDGLGQIYMFHFNGFMRERALIKIDPANVSEFLFTATVFKLNDWVPEVRRAAARLLAKMAKNNDCTKFTKAINYLSGQTLSWKRWHDVKDVYLSFQHSPQVMAILAGELCAAKNGAQSRKFRNLLRDSSIDEHLHKLALQAKLPAVRTIALSTLLEGQARWVTGKQRQWIDKRYNIYRMEKSWRSREITCVANIEAILKITATDKTVTVRKIAADFLITHQETASNVPEIISILENDKYLSIRKRIDFIIQKRRAL